MFGSEIGTGAKRSRKNMEISPQGTVKKIYQDCRRVNAMD
jgi:hypothetical protein